MDALEMSLLYDYYGGLLTGKQRQCFDLRYNQDLSLGEIAQVMGVSRQAVSKWERGESSPDLDNLMARTEALLRKMESSIGCVGRDLRNRNALRTILDAAERLKTYPDETVSALAGEIIEAAQDFEE